MSLDIEALGFTKQELQDRVVEAVSRKVLESVGYDEDGDEVGTESKFAKTVEKRVRAHIDASINALAEKHILPNVATYIENLTLQETNQWGEKRGKQVTFIEYLTQRADAYMREEVNYEGKAKTEANGYSWSKTGTRVAFMVDKHLHYSIESAMRDALAKANSSIVEGLKKAVEVGLDNVRAKLTVDVKTK